MNVMASRVFLHTRFQVGHFKEPSISNRMSQNGPQNWSAPHGSAVIALGPLQFANRDEGAKSNQPGIPVEVTVLSERWQKVG